MSDPADSDLSSHYLENVKTEFRRLKSRGEGAMAQLTDEASFHVRLDGEANSIAILVRHISGNMLSRWTDFLTSDGEKPDRNRDAEFEPSPASDGTEIMQSWERGWACLFSALDALEPGDLLRAVTIRGESHSVLEAANRQLSHYASHLGQIVLLAKHIVGEGWRSLSIPRGRSSEHWSYKGPASP